ncbi:hypothetical protein BC831DRAFT_477134, partial [Entophlyctis helioformis]
MITVSVLTAVVAASAASAAAAATAPAPALFSTQLARCPALPPRQSPPTSVKDLRPDDIQVIMVMGDSLAAGLNSRFLHDPRYADRAFKSKTPSEEFRGASFVTGADADAFSVAKALQRFQPRNRELLGVSRGNASFAFCYGPICPAGSLFQPFNPPVYGLNAAQSGSWVTDSNLDNQLKYIDRNYDSIVSGDVKAPWKLLVLEAGFNNVCLACTDLSYKFVFSADKFEATIRNTIDKLRERFTNMVVVLMAPPAMSTLRRIIKDDSTCAQVQSGIENVGCPCLFLDPKVNNAKMDKIAREYNDRLAKIAADYQRRADPSFGVSYDPGLGQADFSIPASAGVTTTAAQYILGGLDCFHPNIGSHANFALGLWNNLFKSQSNKTAYAINPSNKLFCPTADSRILLA